jgi:hypothetical protein
VAEPLAFVVWGEARPTMGRAVPTHGTEGRGIEGSVVAAEGQTEDDSRGELCAGT